MNKYLIKVFSKSLKLYMPCQHYLLIKLVKLHTMPMAFFSFSVHIVTYNSIYKKFSIVTGCPRVYRWFGAIPLRFKWPRLWQPCWMTGTIKPNTTVLVMVIHYIHYDVSCKRSVWYVIGARWGGCSITDIQFEVFAVGCPTGFKTYKSVTDVFVLTPKFVIDTTN